MRNTPTSVIVMRFDESNLFCCREDTLNKPNQQKVQFTPTRYSLQPELITMETNLEKNG